MRVKIVEIEYDTQCLAVPNFFNKLIIGTDSLNELKLEINFDRNIIKMKYNNMIEIISFLNSDILLSLFKKLKYYL